MIIAKRSRLRRTVSVSMMLAAVLIGSAGCSIGDEVTSEISGDLKSLPWKMTLNHHAIVTTPNTPVQLSYTVTNVYGEPLTNLPPVVYTTSDTSVKIDASGSLTVSTVNQLRYVWATITNPDAGWTVADTIRIQIEDSVYSFARFELALTPDSVVPSNRTPSFPARVLNAAGDTVRAPSGSARSPVTYFVSTALNNIFFQSSRWNTNIIPRAVGTTEIYAISHIFGQDYYDTLQLRSTLPDSVVIIVHRVSYNLTPSPSVISQPDITVLRGGKVTFYTSNTTKADDVVFDDQAAVIDGNVSAIPAFPGHSVTFPTAGKFTYSSSALDSEVKGTITVVER